MPTKRSNVRALALGGALLAVAVLSLTGHVADGATYVAQFVYGVRYDKQASKPSNCADGRVCTWADTSSRLHHWNGTRDAWKFAGDWSLNRTAVADAAKTVADGEYMISYTSLSATRNVTLPLASTGAGRVIVIADESGSASGTVKLRAIRSGSDTVNGSTSAVDVVTVAYGSAMCVSNGSTKWSCHVEQEGGGGGTLQDAYDGSGAGPVVISQNNTQSGIGLEVNAAGDSPLQILEHTTQTILAEWDSLGRLFAPFISLVKNALGTSTAPAVSLENTTAAANGAQQVSPMLEFIGRGWQAGGTNASQTVKTGFHLIPVQGSSFPASVRMAWRTAMGGSAYSDALYFDHDENANPQIKNATNLVTGVDFGSTLQLNSSSGVMRMNADVWPNSDFGFDLGEGTVRRWKYVWARAHYSISQTPAFSSTMTVDCKLGEVVLVTLTASLGSWSMTNGQAPGQKCTIVWIQGGSGSYTIGTPPSGIKWLPSTYLGTNHVAPTLSTAVGTRDASYFVWDGTYWLEVNRNFNN